MWWIYSSVQLVFCCDTCVLYQCDKCTAAYNACQHIFLFFLVQFPKEKLDASSERTANVSSHMKHLQATATTLSAMHGSSTWGDIWLNPDINMMMMMSWGVVCARTLPFNLWLMDMSNSKPNKHHAMKLQQMCNIFTYADTQETMAGVTVIDTYLDMLVILVIRVIITITAFQLMMS